MVPDRPSYFSLATETEFVRAQLAAYGNDLIGVGIDGMRLDAAKSEACLLAREVRH